jgi:hypothetical protein
MTIATTVLQANLAMKANLYAIYARLDNSAPATPTHAPSALRASMALLKVLMAA